MNDRSEHTSHAIDKKLISAVQKKLKDRRFQTVVLHSEKAVKDFINRNIPDNCTVGLGDSITTCKLNIRNILHTKGSIIFYSWDGSENYNRSLDTFDTQQSPDYYLTRITALTFKGEILLKDYSKQAAGENKFPLNIFAFAGYNRLAEMLYERDSLQKYPVIDQCPKGIKFTLALLPFLDY
jgi:hypothetical protein